MLQQTCIDLILTNRALFAMTLRNANLTQRTWRLSRRLYSAFLTNMRRLKENTIVQRSTFHDKRTSESNHEKIKTKK